MGSPSPHAYFIDLFLNQFYPLLLSLKFVLRLIPLKGSIKFNYLGGKSFLVQKYFSLINHTACSAWHEYIGMCLGTLNDPC